ncbi:MAG: GLPGLI family protein, partial [Phaeodactylibacter sp.]|nr:GLPGLI family protein [Phaeodactylibacter sp.]
MKRLLVLYTLLLPLFAAAQPAGRIIYEEKFNLHKGLGPDQEAHKAMIPEFQVSKSQLLYDGQAALYGAYEEAEDINAEPEEGVNIQIRRASNSIYFDYANDKQVEQRDFIGKLFIIETPVEKPEWKVLPEQKSILGYPCQKATYTNK